MNTVPTVNDKFIYLFEDDDTWLRDEAGSRIADA